MTAPHPPSARPRRVQPGLGFVVLSVAVFALLPAAGAAIGPAAAACAVGVVSAALAVGWADLLGAPMPHALRWLLLPSALAMTLAVALVDSAPRLRWLPAVVAVGMIATFFQQVLRRDGRYRLTAGVVAALSGLALMACGMTLVPVAASAGGAAFVLVGMTGLVAGAVADLLLRRRAGGWLVLVVLGTGAAASGLAALLIGEVRVVTAAGLGMVLASLSHSLRRMLLDLPDAELPLARVAAAAASVLLTGGVFVALGRLVGL